MVTSKLYLFIQYFCFLFVFYVLNVMGLLYFTLMQNQRFHYHRDANILQGHEKVVWDMQDTMDNWRVGSPPLLQDTTPSLRKTFKTTPQNWTEMWHKHDNFWACLQAPPLGWTQYLALSVGRIIFLWKNKSSHFWNFTEF